MQAAIQLVSAVILATFANGAQDPKLVNVAVFVDDFFGIDDTDQTFQVDVYVFSAWAGKAITGNITTSKRELTPEEFKTIRTPNLALPNAIRVAEIWTSVFLLPTGNENPTENRFERIQRMRINFQAEMDYTGYPWDSQDLEIKIEPRDYHSVGMQLVPYSPALDGIKSLEYPQWDVSSIDSSIVDKTPNYKQLALNRTKTKSRYEFVMHAHRRSTFFIVSHMLPVSCIVIVSWSCFAIDIKQLMPRICVSFISFLTFHSFAARAEARVPDVSYTTWISVYNHALGLLIFLSCCANLFCHVLHAHAHGKGGVRWAKHIDKICLRMFPATTAIVQLQSIVLREHVALVNVLVYVVMLVASVVLIGWTRYTHRMQIKRHSTATQEQQTEEQRNL